MEVDRKPTMFRKLGVCEVCADKDAKYTCPRCEIRTCSLMCVKIHKKELDCDGLRDRVKFKPVQKLGNLDLQNDYRLLEEMTRNLAVLQKDSSKIKVKRNMPVQLFKLLRAAKQREITLQFLPQNFTRHQVNSTYLKWKTQELFWRIEWIFPQADDFTVSDDRVLDTDRLAAVLNKHLKSQPEDSKQLLFYQAAGLAGLTFLLKAERVPGGKRFYELDPSMSIRENLEGKMIIEFPTIYVLLKDHKFMYDVIEQSEEEKIAEQNKYRRQNRKNDRGKIQQKEGNETNGNTNLLFSNTDEVIVKTEPEVLAEETNFPIISYEYDY